MRIAATVFFCVVTCAWSTVMFAWVDNRQREDRRRAIHAAAALRRRIDRELDGLRYLLIDRGIVQEPAAGNFGPATTDTGPMPTVRPVPQKRDDCPDPPCETEPMALGDHIEADARAYVIRGNWIADDPDALQRAAARAADLEQRIEEIRARTVRYTAEGKAKTK